MELRSALTASLLLVLMSSVTTQAVDSIVKEMRGGIASGIIVENYDDDGTYDSCSSWIQLPGQNLYNKYCMMFFYFIGLLYCFLGVSIIADLFMGAIEVITSKEVTKEVILPTGEKVRTTFSVWNPTIANLSLMALGSSAPEILLSLLGAVQDVGTSNVDELGPGTIVGSAAFNLLVIGAICIMAIPDGQGRFFYDIKVFAVTAVASIFAYLWLYIVVAVWTPDYVTVEEAAITFLFFPILLFLAYSADKGIGCSARSGGDVESNAPPSARLPSTLEWSENPANADGHAEKKIVAGKVTVDGDVDLQANREDMRTFMKKMKEDGTDDINVAGRLALAQSSPKRDPKKSNWLSYRRNAIRAMAGKSPVKPSVETILEEKQHRDALDKDENPFSKPLAEEEGSTCFLIKQFAVMESVGTIDVVIIRTGKLEPQKVRVVTRDGTATGGEDFEKIDASIDFASGEDSKHISVKIIDDDECEPDEEFYLDLMEPSWNLTESSKILDTCTIEIIDDDKPGILSFEYANYTFIESEKCIKGKINRRDGADGKVTVELAILEESAKNHVNFEAPDAPQVITLEHHQIQAEFTLKLIDTNCDGDLNKTLKLKLQNQTGGATLSTMRLCGVTISNDAELSVKLDQLQAIMEARRKMLDPNTSSWSSQFTDALVIKGDVDEITGVESPPSAMANTLHFLSISWKVLFAVVPPTDIWGGWAAFSVAIVLIGILTAVIGEIATLFGCSCGLKPGVTAITFVALGTSLPDTFASSQAATSEDYCDSAIGNITGSNAVNVFLGLGLPWLYSSIYWVVKGDNDISKSGSKGYYLPAGDLSFSVVIFIVFASLALLTMTIRNYKCGGVLGGNKAMKTPTAIFFVIMWFVYIMCASLKMYGNI